MLTFMLNFSFQASAKLKLHEYLTICIVVNDEKNSCNDLDLCPDRAHC